MRREMNRNQFYLVIGMVGFGIVLASWTFGQQQQDFSKGMADAVNKFNSCEYQWGLCRKNCANEHPLQTGLGYQLCKDGCDNTYDKCIKNEKKGKGVMQRGGSSPSGGKTQNLEPVSTATPRRRVLQGTEAAATQSATATPAVRSLNSSKTSGTQETPARRSKTSPAPTPTP